MNKPQWPLRVESASASAVGESPRKRCFVVSPIGSPKSDIREHADDVFDFVIKPAAERAGYFVHRGDHNQAPGKITDQMFESILEDDLIIAVLTYQNPNVYFELAVAQSAARPVILLIAQGEDLPFDLKDQRVIHYDLRPRPLQNGEYSDRLYEAIREIEIKPTRTVPFAPDRTPLSSDGATLSVLARQRDYPTEKYFSLLGSSEQFLMMCGISLQSWHKRVYGDTLLRQVERGCQVQVLLMDEENPALGQMLNDSTPVHIAQEEIKDSFNRWRGLEAKYGRVQVRTVKRGIILQQSTLNENAVVYTPYQFSVTTTDSPTFVARSTSPIYQAQKQELERLWRDNPPPAAGAA